MGRGNEEGGREGTSIRSNSYAIHNKNITIFGVFFPDNKKKEYSQHEAELKYKHMKHMHLKQCHPPRQKKIVNSAAA